MKTQRHPQKPEVHDIIATLSDNVHKNLVKIGFVVFEICERSDKHTDTLIAITRSPLASPYRIRILLKKNRGIA